MRISDWSSDVCSSDLPALVSREGATLDDAALFAWESGFLRGEERPDINMLLDAIREDLDGGNPVVADVDLPLVEYGHAVEDAVVGQHGRASCRERGCQDV